MTKRTTAAAGAAQPAGALGLTLVRGDGARIDAGPIPILRAPTEHGIETIRRHGLPREGLPDRVNAYRLDNARHLWRAGKRVLIARALGIPHVYGALWLKHLHGDTGEIDDLGLVSLALVTDNGMGFVVDAFQNLVELENMKFHGFGTGVAAESATDSALGTELTTQYNPDSTRPTGTTAEASQKVYQTVATLTPDSGGTIAVTEHGVFSQAATGGGVLLDRSVFSAVNVVAAADSLQATYQLTFNSGG